MVVPYSPVPWSTPWSRSSPRIVVEQLGREGAVADPRLVRLVHPHHAVHRRRSEADAEASPGRHRGRDRGGDVGVGAVVEVEEGALGALEQDLLAPVVRVLHEPRGVGHVGPQLPAVLAVLVADLLVVERFAAVELGDDAVLVGQHEAQQRLERLGLHEVDDAHAEASGLVGEGRAGAGAGGADGVLAAQLLVELVDGEVPRHDDVCAVADAHARGVDAALVEHRQLVEQGARVDDHAVARRCTWCPG